MSHRKSRTSKATKNLYVLQALSCPTLILYCVILILHKISCSGFGDFAARALGLEKYSHPGTCSLTGSVHSRMDRTGTATVVRCVVGIIGLVTRASTQ